MGTQRTGDSALGLATGWGDIRALGLHTPFWGALPALPPGMGSFCLWGRRVASLRGRRIACPWGRRVASLWGRRVTSLWGRRVASLWSRRVTSLWGRRVASIWGRRIASLWGRRVASLWSRRVASPRGRRITFPQDMWMASLLLACPPVRRGRAALSNAEPILQGPDREHLCPQRPRVRAETWVSVSSSCRQRCPAGPAMGRGMKSLSG